MTVNQMIESFLVYYDRITSFSAPGYQPGEILLFLNNGQDDFIKDRMFGPNFQPPAFEENQKRVADLRTLVTSNSLTYTTTDTIGLRQYTIPTDFLYPIKPYALCTRSGYPVITSGELMECKPVKSDQVGKLLNSTYNKTYFIKPYYTITGTSLHLIIDRFTTNTSIILHYIKKPTELVTGGSCDLPIHTHQEIVEISVRQALQVLQDPRWQTAVAEDKLKSN
jgi:hypothetical protein